MQSAKSIVYGEKISLAAMRYALCFVLRYNSLIQITKNIQRMPMPFIADLHIHSHYSRATSKQLNLEHLHKWGQLKGLQVIATGDFTHPAWLDELEQKLEPAEPGLFRLKDEHAKTTQSEVPKACESTVRFILSTEISNIYKKNDRVRKVHNVVMVPSIEAARKLQKQLEKIGNIRSDGRPILGLDSKHLLEMVLETDDLACLIPAHIWTPWFSVLGSKSGFDSIDECFDELTEHIFAVETGLSSDPPMNWRVSHLDRFTLVSNSDAHSPQKLAREANIFNCELSYPAMLQALKSGNPEQFGGTIEFFPEEGKYHLDGHRKCNTRMSPGETAANNGLCPVCGKPVTVGVSYRVDELADRPLGESHPRAFPFESIIPLPEVVSDVKNVGPNSKAVTKLVDAMFARLGNELTILRQLPLTDIEKIGGSLMAEAIRRTRAGELQIAGGYDGEFGTIEIFTDEERKKFSTLQFFFADEKKKHTPDNIKQTSLFIRDEADNPTPFTVIPIEISSPDDEAEYNGLNRSQHQAVHADAQSILIVAGPGTGKTRTLTRRIHNIIENQQVLSENILAITFTNKAADEMRERIMHDKSCTPNTNTSNMTISTFHSLGTLILREQATLVNYPADFSIYNDSDCLQVMRSLLPDTPIAQIQEYRQRISDAKNQSLTHDQCDDGSAFPTIYRQYQAAMQLAGAFDFDDLILRPIRLLQAELDMRTHYQEKFRWIFVDEYQDINQAQYKLLKLLVNETTNLCVIGDPDQAIYGFRGSDVKYFHQFKTDFPDAQTFELEKNYRSTRNIVNAARQVIQKSPGWSANQLWSDIISEGKLDIIQAPTEKAEAETIVHSIEQLVGGFSFFSVDSARAGYEDTSYCSGFSDIAVLYRTNAQLFALEEAFIRSGMPYQTAGETPFWEHPEVREVLSYIRVLLNPASDIDLMRILNVPPRGIGDQTFRIIMNYKHTNQLSLWKALKQSHYISSLSETQKTPIRLFVDRIVRLQQSITELKPVELIERVLIDSGMKAYYKNDSKRAYYWQELHDQAVGHSGDVRNFLERIALRHESDSYDPRAEKVMLMTLHASKGLEFPVVFITGCEDGLIPFRQDGKLFDLEEERRLFYVGLSRAKHKLILTRANNRFLFGKRTSNNPSPFLADIEIALKEFRRSEIKRRRKDADTKQNDGQMSLF
ncbi:UvrD-helicase domain-containing protein [candidate division KSB1 bacterium]|nr:UvrD-helicase domain-containing protein [candidate division KSB1 bacterium]